MSEPLTIAGVHVERGSRTVMQLPVTLRLDGSILQIACHVLHGAADGPTLTVVGTLHGDQWSAIEPIRRLTLAVDPARLRGTLITIPIANPMAFERGSRVTPDDSDQPDLNRVFPGGDAWLTEQMARVITANVLERTDVLINHHTGVWGSCLATVDHLGGITDATLAERTARLAVAYGYPSLRSLGTFGSNVYPGPRAIGAWSATARRIPSIAPNVGGAGFGPAVEESWHEANVRGIRNVMIDLGMLEGRLELPDRFLSSRGRGHRVTPRAGGMLEPAVGPERLLGPIERGTLLGTVVNPHTFAVADELVAPATGYLFGVATRHPVWPGDWAYFIADSDDRRTTFIDGADLAASTARLLELERMP